MCYLAFCAGWLFTTLAGVGLGHDLPASFVLAPLWLPFAIGGLLLAFLCLATLALSGAAWGMSVYVEWRARRRIGRVDA